MRNYIKYMVFAVAAALLLSGCNTDKAVTTTADTSTVTEEVTAAVSADEPDAVIDDKPEPETIDPSTMRDLSMPENPFDLPDPSGYEGLEHYTEQYKFEFTNFDSAILSLVDKNEFDENDIVGIVSSYNQFAGYFAYAIGKVYLIDKKIYDVGKK